MNKFSIENEIERLEKELKNLNKEYERLDVELLTIENKMSVLNAQREKVQDLIFKLEDRI